MKEKKEKFYKYIIFLLFNRKLWQTKTVTVIARTNPRHDLDLDVVWEIEK